MLEEIKQSRKVGVNYMKWVETVYYERKEASEQTRKESATIIKAHLAGMSDDQIAEHYGYTIDDVQDVITEFENAQVMA